ncbi:MAG TPA: hypothetical protein VE129_18720 [Thermoanaerobaculia bacterium]|nr:hypothetical protein [Thermoanaerobaculia bacterium]
MTRPGSEPYVPCAPDLVREVRSLAVAGHERFDREVWASLPAAAIPGVSPTPSYHNERHVAAVCDGVEAVFEAMAAGSDPFGIARDARRWAESTGDPEPGFEALRTAFGVAFACHDLGNIAASTRISVDGSGLGLEHARFYDSSALYATPAVEIRSAAIAHELLVSKGGACGRVPALARLVEHLVLQTVFHYEKVSDETPFWFPMQVVDMIGSYFFLSASRLEAIAGLFAEMRVQRPGSIPVLPFLTSLEERFEKLVADPGARQDVLAAFERNAFGRTAASVFDVPDRYLGMSRPIPYEEAIAALLAPG